MLYPLVLEYVIAGLQFVRYAPVNEVASKVLANIGRRYQLSCWPAVSRLLEATHTCRSTSGRRSPAAIPEAEDGAATLSSASVRAIAGALLHHGTMPFAGTDPAMFGIEIGSS